MILTCPSCGTQYAVKDGAIPPHGRQVRCASCKHAWHQDPDTAAGGAPLDVSATTDTTPAEDAPGGAFDDHGEPIDQSQAAEITPGDAAAPAADALASAPAAPPGEALAEDAPASGTGTWTPPPEDSAPSPELAAPPERAEPAAAARVAPVDAGQAAYDEDFSPFTLEERGARRARSPLVSLLMTAVLIAVLAAAFWFLAPPEWKERVGIAAAGETPLQLMMTHSDRQRVEPSGNELLTVSGRVINPTDETQDVPPIRAELRSSSGKLVYSWTIAPPARTLPPGASATFNSTEVNVPAGGDELTVALGSAKT